MIRTMIGASLALFCLSQASFAQDIKTAKFAAVRIAAGNHETLDASMARLAMKAAFQPTAQPTQQELLSVILLMSLRQQHPSHT